MRRVVLLFTAALLAATLIVTGCGTTTKKPTNDATQILKDSRKAMLSVKSYKGTGSISLASSAQGASSMNVTFEMQIQQNGPKDLQGHIIMHSSGQDMETYIANGYAYSKDPTKGWTKQPVGEVTDFSKLATPADISKLGAAAKDARLISQSGEYYKVSFSLNTNYLMDLMGLSKSTKGLTAQEKKNAEAMVKGMTMGAVFQIQKPTMYIQSMAMNFLFPNMPNIGSVKMGYRADLSDFNKPVKVTLPEDAKNAQEVTGSGTFSPTP
jgi:hypothetical protein